MDIQSAAQALAARGINVSPYNMRRYIREGRIVGVKSETGVWDVSESSVAQFELPTRGRAAGNTAASSTTTNPMVDVGKAYIGLLVARLVGPEVEVRFPTKRPRSIKACTFNSADTDTWKFNANALWYYMVRGYRDYDRVTADVPELAATHAEGRVMYQYQALYYWTVHQAAHYVVDVTGGQAWHSDIFTTAFNRICAALPYIETMPILDQARSITYVPTYYWVQRTGPCVID